MLDSGFRFLELH